MAAPHRPAVAPSCDHQRVTEPDGDDDAPDFDDPKLAQWTDSDLSGRIASGRPENYLWVIRVLAFRAAKQAKDIIELRGALLDAAGALDSLAGTVQTAFEQEGWNLSGVDNPEGHRIVLGALDRMRHASHGLDALADGWI